jgi:hypothetical protein
MPWHLEENAPGCSGYAVVKDDDSAVEGCHASRAEAAAQLKALYASEAAQMSLDELEVSPRQVMQYYATEAIVEVHGKFDQSSGADGAHYVAENPFAAEGLSCANCVFYEGPQACEVVEGVIAPMAICKLWIIPDAMLV